jgi:hypothetical protein
MASYSRLILQVAATTGVAVMLSTAAPAVAAEGPVTARETAATASTVRPAVKRHASRRPHLVVSPYNRRVDLIGTSPACSDVWCGRQFVLMIGVGY